MEPENTHATDTYDGLVEMIVDLPRLSVLTFEESDNMHTRVVAKDVVTPTTEVSSSMCTTIMNIPDQEEEDFYGSDIDYEDDDTYDDIFGESVQ